MNKYKLPLLFIVSGLIYIPALNAPFLRDDFYSLVTNYKMLFSCNFFEILFPGVLDTRPLEHLFNRLFIEMFSLKEQYFHIRNLILHMLNALVLYKVSSKLLKNKNKAFWVFAVFLLHPLQTEAVSHIYSSMILWATLFCSLSIYMFILSEERNKKLLYFLSVSFGLLAAGFYEASAILPIVIFLCAYLLQYKKNIFRKIFPFFLVPFLIALLFLFVENPHGPNTGFNALNPWLHFITQWKVLGMFLLKFIFPFGLNFDYAIEASRSVFDVYSLLGLLILLLISAAVFFLRAKLPQALFAWIFFLITIAPTNSIYPNIDFAAERHLYLPIFGLSLLLVSFLSAMKTRHTNYIKYLFIIFLSVLTFLRNDVWSSDIKLFEDTIKKSPEKDRPCFGLARAYVEKNMYKKALAIYKKCIKNTKPTFRLTLAYFSLGNTYAILNRFEEAIEAYQKSYELRPRPNPLIFKSLVYLQMDKIRQAKEELNKAKFIKPHDKILVYAFGMYYKKLNNKSLACESFKRACDSYYMVACTEFQNLCK